MKWDGLHLTRQIEPPLPVTTSSFDTGHVIRARTELFAKLKISGLSALEAYHFSRDLTGDPYSVWMTRDDAQTVSFSRVRVTQGNIEFQYRARGNDGTPAEAQIVTLPRAA